MSRFNALDSSEAGYAQLRPRSLAPSYYGVDRDIEYMAEKPGLSTGAKVGIGAAIAVGLGAAAWFLLTDKQKKQLNCYPAAYSEYAEGSPDGVCVNHEDAAAWEAFHKAEAEYKAKLAGLSGDDAQKLTDEFKKTHPYPPSYHTWTEKGDRLYHEGLEAGREALGNIEAELHKAYADLKGT